MSKHKISKQRATVSLILLALLIIMGACIIYIYIRDHKANELLNYMILLK